MRKRNKILMATVSVLLCLVLVTTSGLSGIYAKYTTKDSASLNVGFKKLGVDVVVNVDRNAIEKELYGSTTTSNVAVTTSTSGNQVSVSVSGMKIGPDDDLSKLFKVTVSGTPQVKCRVKTVVYFSYGSSYDSIKTADKTYYMPVGFTFGALPNASSNTYVIPNNYLSRLGCWRTYTGTSQGTVGTNVDTSSPIGIDSTEWRFTCDIQDLIDVTSVKDTTANTGSYFYKDFDPNSTDTKVNTVAFYADSNGAKINTLEFGFKWPYEYPDGNGTTPEQIAQYDALAKKIAEINKDKTLFTMTYTISVEQITT